MAHRSCCFAILFLIILLGVASITPPTTTLADGGGSMSVGDIVVGDLSTGERDTWLFNGRSGQVVSIVAERDLASLLDTSLILFDPSNVALVSAEDGGITTDAALFAITLPSNGIYAIVVTGGTTAGNYQLTIAETSPSVVCDDFAPTAITDTWDNAATFQQHTYRVILPPCYDSTLRYPYILLLHGSDTTHTLWDQLGIDEALAVGIALNRMPPVVLVLPDGGDIANLDRFDTSDSYENLLLNGLMPIVEADYCLQNSGEGRAIGGISRGGFWAYTIGFRHPDQFTAIGGHSPVFYYSGYIPNAHNPLTVIETLTPTDQIPRLWIDRGINDWWAYNIDLMGPLLQQQNLAATVTIYPTGTHDNAYWRSHLNEYLAFYTADWTLEDYPPCD